MKLQHNHHFSYPLNKVNQNEMNNRKNVYPIVDDIFFESISNVYVLTKHLLSLIVQHRQLKITSDLISVSISVCLNLQKFQPNDDNDIVHKQDLISNYPVFVFLQIFSTISLVAVAVNANTVRIFNFVRIDSYNCKNDGRKFVDHDAIQCASSIQTNAIFGNDLNGID
ncbi:hypothetical protein DERP_006145 [Dermatophagoides pteronyssinus]|uniref:Uncharacterized protein n=1 Tax=Dermatophagoides pteronyssinus TaxID=6956 RepID=A0ABQ8JSF7_DERPT|nr:hypothetical protein DERP_006145 [Dermatophagoides pteronyssinus]